MSELYDEFDGVILPLLNHSQNHSAMPAESRFIDSIGGVFDWRGTEQGRRRKQPISLQGVYLGEVEYLVDETGDFLVDETGDYLIAGDAEEMLLSQIAPLLEKIGTSGPLWRRRLADGVRHWKTAHLLEVPWMRRWEDHAVKAEVSCRFESDMEFWHEATLTTVSGTTLADLGLFVSNGGMKVNDATVTVTGLTGTISTFTLVCVELGISWSWAGSLAIGEVLTIDTRAETVRKGSSDAYSGFELEEAHSAAKWLPIPRGDSVFLANVTGGYATVAINYYTQVA